MGTVLLCQKNCPRDTTFPSHSLLESEHTVVRELLIRLLPCIRIIWIGMVAVVELHDMKAAAIHVEVNVPLLEVRSDSLPDLYLRVQPLYSAPCGIADSLAVYLGRYKQQVEIAVFSVNFDEILSFC